MRVRVRVGGASQGGVGCALLGGRPGRVSTVVLRSTPRADAGAPPSSHSIGLPTPAQAFCAVQSSVVHLQGVPLGRRFALVPLGPPLLTYSSTAKAMLK